MVRSRNYIATPPGATIKEQLDSRGMSQKEFALRMDMSQKHISHLINGDVQLTPEMAERLELVLCVPARFWNNLESIYREKIIKAEIENRLEADEEIAKCFPYSEMVKLGWVPQTRKLKEKVVNLRKFFEVVDLSILKKKEISKIACRRLTITEKGDLALMAWAQEARIIARDIKTEPINIKKLTQMIPAIRSMTVLKPKEFYPKIKENLAKCGVAIVLLPHLNGSFLQGATMIDGNKIVMGLTLRGKDADRFWFSFFHELAHIILSHVLYAQDLSDLEEKEADDLASDILIPEEDFVRFKIDGDYSENNVIQFAQKLGIAPGIVVGRMQAETVIEYNMLNNLKEHYEICD